MNKFLLVMSLTLPLAACVTSEEQHAADLAADQKTCLEYGFQKGTQDFASCMMQLGDRRAVQDMVYRQNAARIGSQLLNDGP